MKKSHGGATAVSDKPSRPKSREVSSRFLRIPSPSHETTSSPLHGGLKHRNDDSNFIAKLWPSTTQKSSQKQATLAHHLGHERQNDKHNSLLTRQRSCSTTSQSRQNKFDNKDDAAATKENHRPFFGGSMRYTGKFRFPGRSSISSSPSDSESSYGIIPGRLSIDETALRQRSFGARSDLSSSENLDSGSECSDMDSSLGSPFVGKTSPASSYMSATVSSSFRKSGKEVSSKYMNDQQHHRRGSGDASLLARRVSALKWGLSPGRYSGESPPVEGGKVGKPPTSPSKGKLPPTSPSRGKGVGGLINLGLDLFKSKKPFPSSSGGVVAVGVAVGAAESVHQLRVLHNRLVQLRYVNCRSESVNGNVVAQTQTKLLHASAALTNLQLSVLQKKLQLKKEKLQMKLYYILRSQIKPLEAWSDVERQHLSAVLRITDSLHSVVCRVPLIEGAVVEPESASFALRYASDLAVSLESMLSTFSPTADKTVEVLAELAEVASQEKSALEECLELSRFISTLEMEERSLKCTVIQLKSQEQDQRLQQEITA